MKHTIKLLTLAAILTAVFGLTGCPGPVNNYIEPVVVPEYTITVNVTNGTAVNPAKAKAGDHVTITATADEGFVFDGASSAFNIPDYSVTNNGTVITWNLVMPASDVTINVVFKDNTTVDDDNSDEPEQTTPEDTDNGDTEEENEEEEIPTETQPEDNDPVDEEDDTDNNDVEDDGGEETTQWTYVAGGCDDPNCTEPYEFDNLRIYGYVYNKVSDLENDINGRVIYFSYPEGTDRYTTISLDDLIHQKSAYTNRHVIKFAIIVNEEFKYFDLFTWSLNDLSNGSPIYIVIE